jgi:hypothetical protein
VSWTPGEGYHNPDDKKIISVTFSGSPDKTSVERSFSLTADGAVQKGVFIWHESTIEFAPDSHFENHLEKNIDYILTVTSDAQDEDGLALETNFERRFSTRPNAERPAVVSINPIDEEVILDKHKKIVIDFSEKILLASCYSDIRISPSMEGSWQLENDGARAVFIPREEWGNGKFYKTTISAMFESADGKFLGKEYVSRFSCGVDFVKPFLESVYALDKNKNSVFKLIRSPSSENATGVLTENALWENDYSLRFIFSEQVALSKIKNCISIEPSLMFDLENNSGFSNTAVCVFTEKPAYGKRYAVHIKAGLPDAAGNESDGEVIYRIYANGEHSKPPELAAIRMPKNTAEPNTGFIIYKAANIFAAFELDTANYTDEFPVWMELYFDVAKNASITINSVRDLFRIDNTNNAVNFSARKIIDNNFSIIDPANEYRNLYRIEIRGMITNTENSGVVTFYIAGGLEDSYGNINDDAQRITTIK